MSIIISLASLWSNTGATERTAGGTLITTSRFHGELGLTRSVWEQGIMRFHEHYNRQPWSSREVMNRLNNNAARYSHQRMTDEREGLFEWGCFSQESCLDAIEHITWNWEEWRSRASERESKRNEDIKVTVIRREGGRQMEIGEGRKGIGREKVRNVFSQQKCG